MEISKFLAMATDGSKQQKASKVVLGGTTNNVLINWSKDDPPTVFMCRSLNSLGASRAVIIPVFFGLQFSVLYWF